MIPRYENIIVPMPVFLYRKVVDAQCFYIDTELVIMTRAHG